MARTPKYLVPILKYLVLPVMFLALLLLISSPFSLDTLFNFLEPQELGGLTPFVGFAVGAIAQYILGERPSLRARRQLLLRRCISFAVTFLILFGLAEVFVKCDEYVISWGRTPSLCDCPVDDSPEDCLNILAAHDERTQQKIYKCWGQASVRAIEFSLAVLYLLLAGLFGSISGLLMLPKPSFRVFVSYRRKDSDRFVNDILAGPLRNELGKNNVFVDKHAILGGENWARKIKAWCEVCQAVIVVVGPVWLRELEKKRETTDWVKVEIETAIRKEIRLLPVVIGVAEMPSESDLPESMAPLARVQAVTVDKDSLDLGEDFRILDRPKIEKAVDEILVAIGKLRVLSS